MKKLIKLLINSNILQFSYLNNFIKTIYFKILISITSILFLNISLTKASVISYTKDTDGITFKLDTGLMKIKICTNDIIEVKYTSLDSIARKTSLVVNNQWLSIPSFDLSKANSKFVISTNKLKVTVDSATQSIQYFTLNNNLILAEDNTQSKTMTAATIVGIKTYNCSTQFLSPTDEALFGLGCHPTDQGSMNYKGRNQDMAIQYMTGAIPVLLSNKGYGIMWDNYSASNFYGSVASNTKYKYISESGKMVDYYFFYGPEFDHIISSYRIATGTAPMFPKWAFGLFQSQDRYQSQAEVLSVKNNYRNNRLPVDCIVQDWYYWYPDFIGSHIMYPTNYPDPKGMVDSLHKANIHAMISIWPVFDSTTNNFTALKNIGGLTSIIWSDVMTHKWDTYYDAHSLNARNLYWNQANQSLISKYGWDAWWVDQCEPDNGGDLDARRKSVFAIGKGIDYFNTYSLMHSEGLYSNWRKDISGKRAFFLIRQAFAGQQRNATTLWSSDITCTFSSYKIQVPQGINACASGIPYWTSDIGGYHLNWAAPDWTTAANRELFTRWFQFGTFCPIFRIHGKGERALFSKNWDASTKAILLNYDNLRYRLMPYIYSLGWKVTNENYTIMRALAFDFRTDAAINNIQDQYMFGPSFLVNPVTAQLYSNSSSVTIKTRKVYLPASTTWYDFWTGESYSGGQTINSEAPIEKIPLYIKAGSIIPMGPYLQYATEKVPDTIELRVYKGASGNFTIYEDENDNYNYEKGKHSEIPINYNDTTQQLVIGNKIGSYDSLPHHKTFKIVWVDKGYGIGIGSPYKCDTIISYDGAQKVVPYVSRGKQVAIATKNNNSFNCKIFPNPTENKFNIIINTNISNQSQIKFTDLSGKCVISVSKYLNEGSNSISINTKEFNLSVGIYIVTICSGNYNFEEKVNINS
jgi:alpha-D-xyloside xylohydrolase